MKYLGIDYGSKRVGVALSDEGGVMAFPKKVFANAGIASLVKEIGTFCATEGVNEIVIGDSRDYHGRPNEIMKAIEDFSIALQEEIKLPVHFQLEFMTSAQASRSSAAGKQENRKSPNAVLKGDEALLDASAAAIILQSFLDKKKA
jgi:putative Holliday junction resolvase